MDAFEFNSIAVGGRIDRLRNQRGYSIEDLAGRSGLNKNTVNRVVRGVGKPNLNTFLKLCGALGVTPNDLMTPASSRDTNFRVIRRSDPATVQFHDQEPGVRIGKLVNDLPQGTMGCILVEFSGKSSTRSHVGEELMICTSGRVGLTIGDTSVELDPGDAVVFHATEPHCYYHAASDLACSTACCVLRNEILDDPEQLS